MKKYVEQVKVAAGSVALFLDGAFQLLAQMFSSLAVKLNSLARKLDSMLGKTVYPFHCILVLLLIRYSYIFLTVTVLKDQWYIGYGSYGIDFVFWKEILSSLVFVCVCLLYTQIRIKDRFVDGVLFTLLVLYYIPLNAAAAINNQPILYFLCSNLYFALILFFTDYGMKFISGFGHPEVSQQIKRRKKCLYQDRNVIVFCVIVCWLFIIYKLFYNGIQFSVSMSSDDVYGNRAEYVAFLDEISGTLISYLLSILRNVANFAVPFYVMISLLRKKWKHVALGLFCTLSQYAVSAGKGTLLMVAVIAGLYMLHSMKLVKHYKRILEIGMLVLMAVCLLEHFVLQSDRIFTLLIRRVLYYPAWLSTMYYDYFTKNGPILWTQNVFLLQNIFDPVYDTAPLTIISQTYFDGQIPSPNSGLFAEAVMHFGVAGTVVYPVLLAAVFLISGLVLRQYGMCVQIFMVVKLVLHLQNVPITRTDSVLSYFLFMFVLLVLPKLHVYNLSGGIRSAQNRGKNRR